MNIFVECLIIVGKLSLSSILFVILWLPTIIVLRGVVFDVTLGSMSKANIKKTVKRQNIINRITLQFVIKLRNPANTLLPLIIYWAYLLIGIFLFLGFFCIISFDVDKKLTDLFYLILLLVVLISQIGHIIYYRSNNKK